MILLCWVFGDPERIPVEISPEKTVDELKDAIFAKKPDRFRGIDAYLLVLWKKIIPVCDLNRLHQSDLKDEDELDTTWTIGKYFEEAPQKEGIHIVIKVPEPPNVEWHTTLSPRQINKRKRSLGENFASRVKRLKVVQISPSSLAQSSKYESLQRTPREKILDDRPCNDDIPPASLLYEGFGEFLDIVAGRTDVEGCNDVDALNLYLAVDEFAESMCRFFPNEDSRADRGRTLLNRIFAARRDHSRPIITAASIGPVNPFTQAVRTDRHFTGDHDVAVLINGFKDQSIENSGLPEVELVGYFAHSFASSTRLESLDENLEGWRVPAFGITIIGPDVKFYALVSLGTQFRLVSLTPGLSCIRSASEGRDRNALYRAFTAASVLQARILKEFGVEDVPQKIREVKDLRLPAVSKLSKWKNMDPRSIDSIKFRIKERFSDFAHSQLVYLAETGDGKAILIKFVRQYCSELHEICAASGHAPALLGYERLPGGWYGIAMEYVANAVPITMHEQIPVHFHRWEKDLRRLISEFHDRGLVHGDLRDANIISGDDGCVKLVDFDWGGKDGEVSYPMPNLNPELTQGRSSDDLRITKADDSRILSNTLAKTSLLVRQGAYSSEARRVPGVSNGS